jgi:general secretion pathway protein A
MSYLEFFGLSSEPFSNAPVSRFYYNAPQHQQALTRLLYVASSMKGLAVLVGDVGAGKTTLARRLLDSLPEEEYEAALLVIIHSGITAGWLLRRLALQLGVENPAPEKLTLLSQLYQRLLQIHEQGRKAVVLIDEAQMLETRELMEEFRGLLNLEVPERKLISFVLFGLPEIEQNLKLDPPLAQRVAMRYRLEPFSSESTEAYLKHRLRLAGSARMPFAADAIEAVHRRSGGTPRVINTLCDNALFEAFLARTQEVRAGLIEGVADNLGLEARPRAPASLRAPEPAPPAPTVPPVPPVLVGGLATVRPSQVLRAPLHPTPLPSVAPAIAPVMMVPALAPAQVPAPLQVLAAPSGPRIIQGRLDLEAPPPPAPLPPEAPPGPTTPRPSAPRPGVDLAEIDRYLEGLGKI